MATNHDALQTRTWTDTLSYSGTPVPLPGTRMTTVRRYGW
jgi:hypothetical protein